MAAALKQVPEMPKDEPIYTDQVIACGYQRTWLLAAGLVVLLAASIGDNIFYHLQPTPPPFVLQVNGEGNPVGQVLPVTSVQVIPDAFMRARLADFIHDAFTVDRDSDEEDYLFDKTQAMVTGQAAQKLDAFYNRDGGKHHPKTMGPYVWIEAPVSDTLKLAEKDTYQADFKTIEHSNNDQTVTKSTWRAVTHVIVARSKDPESLGLFVNELDIQEVKQ
jgi:type IV secretory pathway TrbF-like protein